MGRTLRLIPGGAAEGRTDSAPPAAPQAQSAAGPIADAAVRESSAEVPVSSRPRAASPSAAAPELPAAKGPFATAPVAGATALPRPGQAAAAAFPTDTVPDLRFGERPLGPNDKVDRYIVERLIAAGGMARVYRAYHEWARRPVALKVLRTRYAGRPDLIDRFQKEAMALGQIKHPNVVTLENGGLTPTGEVFIAMEFLDGKTLREVLQERATLPMREALSILIQVADGVAAAHDVNVVHRDIKPENIFCTSFGTVKVLDLGLAKIIGFDSKETDPEGLIGTAAYMAPEQLDGLPADARSDVYSLGLVAYECLAGFHALVPDGNWPSRDEIALRQLTYEPPTLRHLPRALWQVVARAIHKNPAARFASMAEFRAALYKLRQDLAAGVTSDPGPTPSKGERSRTLASTPPTGGSGLGSVIRRYPMVVGALVGLSAAAAIFVWRGRHSGPPESASTALAPAVAAVAPPPPTAAAPTPTLRQSDPIPKPASPSTASRMEQAERPAPSAEPAAMPPHPMPEAPRPRSPSPSSTPKESAGKEATPKEAALKESTPKEPAGSKESTVKERPKRPSTPSVERMPSSGL